MSSTSGTIAHLVQSNNTLSAEIDIAAQSTVMRIKEDGTLIVDPLELINCSQYGNAARNSDPMIGARINKLARKGNSVSIKDPVAIYMQKFDTSTLVLVKSEENQVPLPDGVITWVRGAPPMGLRLHIQIPTGMLNDAGDQLTVSDIFDTQTQNFINHGAQFADYITMGVSGVVVGNAAVADSITCPCAKNNGDIMPEKGTFDGIIRDPRGVEQHRLPMYKFRVR
ncbi:hypothetical protein P167DRAFT_542873 [Morchella conica CCBAS932]|uniref:Uncharacterized protein n=2 Tax=Morchella sect. Distantes TaxID=1051054 RepID=A0A3N4LCK1_9PEZI|nr:hypothetical protein P167DRAFT_542873 [Morchella conica CCBAS932]